MKRLRLILLAGILLFTGCAAGRYTGTPSQGPGVKAERSFTQISQETAKEMMAKDDGHIVVDVRTKEEYAEGHIPGAICIPNESIGCDAPEALSDYGQIILIYCRSGNRSKQAAHKLAEMGFTNVYEFGGIMDWTGETVKGTEGTDAAGKTAELRLESFDGGGPEYRVKIADPAIVSCTSSVHYEKPDHDQMTGAGYTVIYEFRGLAPGSTSFVLSARSPIAENYDADYAVTVDADLNVELVKLSEREL